MAQLQMPQTGVGCLLPAVGLATCFSKSPCLLALDLSRYVTLYIEDIGAADQITSRRRSMYTFEKGWTRL